jgi:hypothetical protein
MKNIDDYSDKGLSIVVGSPVNYDNLVAYIRVDGKKICLLQQEEGKDKFKIVFDTYSTEVVVDFDLFLRGLEEAKKCLRA